MSDKEQILQRWQALRQPVRELLLTEWNPLGDPEIPGDEYDTYVDKVSSMLMDPATTANTLATYLRTIEQKQFGMTDDACSASALDKVANALLALRQIPTKG